MKAKQEDWLSWSHPPISSCLVYLGSHAMHSYFIHDSSYKNKTTETAIKLKEKKKKQPKHISKALSLKISSILAEHAKCNLCIGNTSCNWTHLYEGGCYLILCQMTGTCCYALSWVWNKTTSSWKKPVSLQTGLYYAVWTPQQCICAPHSSGK